MIVESHLEKISRLNALRRKLDPQDDFELWFWSTMVAGTNAVNAALHDAGVTPAESAFPSQPGVYHVPVPGTGGEFKPTLRSVGDVLHVGRPRIEGAIPSDIERMMSAMEQIEQFRDPCTRGDMAIDSDVIDTCERAYRTCIDLLQARGLGVGR